jgi:enamine deaminase RidA (YjgF/YER057c/UK114 family)
MNEIQRIPGNVPSRCWGSAYKDFVWVLGMSDDFSLDFTGQMERSFAALEGGLLEAGSDKTRLISVQVYLYDVARKSEFDQKWSQWIGDNPDHWPMRSCVQVTFAGENKLEMLVVAARNNPD